eukprot:gene3891-13957_t
MRDLKSDKPRILIMISYRVTETGHPDNGGDGSVFAVRDWLVDNRMVEHEEAQRAHILWNCQPGVLAQTRNKNLCRPEFLARTWEKN